MIIVNAIVKPSGAPLRSAGNYMYTVICMSMHAWPMVLALEERHARDAGSVLDSFQAK